MKKTTLLMLLLFAAGALMVWGQNATYPPGSLPNGVAGTGGTTPLVITAANTDGLIVNPSTNGQGKNLIGVGDGVSSFIFRVNGAGGAFLITLGGTFGAHLNVSPANSDISGKLTCASSTVTKTFGTAYTSTPVVLLSDETTAGGAKTAPSTTAFTVTCTGASDVVDYLVIGNPN